MSAQTQSPAVAPDTVSIEIDGKPVIARKGSMIIESTDRERIAVPRFCYHEKLSIAANCRMCLVDVEKSPKPMPACATPVMEGMKVFTRSKRALDAQRNVMEFLLLNHPLDCPICDQGGECELQDVAMGYGRSVSRFTEQKRVVADEDLGALVETEMTRCIHCTRCVRYCTEIAGTPELGGMGRGEHLEIGTYIGRSLTSEMSGGVIDVCPVGALTNKVFRYRARAWELQAKPAVGFHDALGGNLFLHVRRGEALRAVPRDNEAINECWSTDRDRFAHEGFRHVDRLTVPLAKQDGQWRELSWGDALAATVTALRAAAADDTGVLVSPATSCEEGLLLARLARALGVANIDHRLRQIDFADDAARPLAPGFSGTLPEIELADAVLLIGCNPRHDAPLLGHRLRKATLRGAAVHSATLFDDALHFPLASQQLCTSPTLVHWMLELVGAALKTGVSAPPALAAAAAGVTESTAAQALFDALSQATMPRLILGLDAVRHPQASLLRAAAALLGVAVSAKVDELPDGANSAGLWRMGVLPHRAVGGVEVAAAGRHARSICESGLKTLLIYGAEVAQDFAASAALMKTIAGADQVIVMGHYLSDALKEVATLILPIALTPESEATLINAQGDVQRHGPAVRAPGDARPGWRVLRVLGELLELPGFEFDDYPALAHQVDAALAEQSIVPGTLKLAAVPGPASLSLTRRVPIYAADAVLRRCASLQATPLGATAHVCLHPDDAMRVGIGQNGKAKLGQLELPAILTARTQRGSIVVTAGDAETAGLPVSGTVIEAGQ